MCASPVRRLLVVTIAGSAKTLGSIRISYLNVRSRELLSFPARTTFWRGTGQNFGETQWEFTSQKLFIFCKTIIRFNASSRCITNPLSLLDDPKYYFPFLGISVLLILIAAGAN